VITEAAVVALAAALYLCDCVVLLERGQALLEAQRRRLGLSFGSRHYQIGGRAVALANPLTPFIPAFRTRPLFSAPAGVKVSRALRASSPLPPLCALQFLLVFVALPYCLYRAPGWPFVIALALAYLNALAMLALVWWRFGKAGVARRPLIVPAFGWLACLPLSVNCLRSAALSFDLALEARCALRMLPEADRPRARAELAAQLTEAMQELDETDSRHRRLEDLRRTLAPGREP